MKKYTIFAVFFIFVLPIFSGATSVSSAPSASAKIFNATLRQGVSNPDVSTLQTMLKTDSSVYPAGLVTGYFGPATEAAVKKIQKKYGLSQTGIVDEATQAVLYPNPYTTDISIAIMQPNGGELWSAGNAVQILWKSTVSPIVAVPMPVPMMNGGSGTSAGAVTGSDGAVSRGLDINPIGTTGTNTMIKPAPSIMPPPFFNYASIDLTRDSDPSYLHHIGSVNLYESQYSWRIPKSVPEASDYRVRISVGKNVPCMYTNDVQMMKTGISAPTSISRPICASPMIASSFASDASDNVFSIKGGTDPNIIGEIKSQIAQINIMIAKMSAQIAEIEAKLEEM
jgi:peptidoglycan hydrolase-like protein with peptidoglycan-binding domain